MICSICKINKATKGCLTCSFKCSCLAAGSNFDDIKPRLDVAIKDRLVTRYKR